MVYMDFLAEYNRKKRTPEEAVSVVKSGDWVDYTSNVGFPYLLDRALAARRDELHDVKIRGNLCFGPIEAVECDPTREHFLYNSWHCSAYERQLCDKGLCNYIPMIFHLLVPYYRHFLTVNVAMCSVTPMDKHGYFNLSCSTGCAKGILEQADIVILEVNERLPRILGGFDESIHISEVDYIVEGEHPPLPEFPIETPTEEDIRIATHIIPFIRDGATLQLGIGAMPNVIGSMLSLTDIEDLGMHTELCGDAYYELYKAGKLTNQKKTFQRGKGVTGIVFGSRKLYEWVDMNPGVIIEPLEFVNDPGTIAQLDNMVSINSCIAVDLRGIRRPSPDQRHRRPAGLRDRSSHGPRRQSIHLHALFLHRQKGRAPLQHPAPLRGRHSDRSPQPGLLHRHGAGRREPGRPHDLGAGGNAHFHRAPRLQGLADRSRRQAEDLEAVQ